MLTIITVVVIVGIGATIYYISKNNRDRKENLNIIKEGDRLYFYLSDDLFFSVDLERNRKVGEIIARTVKNEIEYLSNSVREISFINFEDKPLEKLLNSMIQLRRMV